MSLANSVNDQDHHHPRNNHVINGPRPSPLRINRESHSIQKPSHAAAGKEIQKRQPVIIYTHSPKIIHAQARDFMALVQKLTGQSRSDNNDDEDYDQGSKRQGRVGSSSSNDMKLEVVGNKSVSHEDNESSSAVTEENYGNDYNSTAGYDVVKVKPSLVSSTATPYLADIPLFTPSAADFFCSPRPGYRCPDTLASPNVGGLFSPSFLEFVKGLPEY